MSPKQFIVCLIFIYTAIGFNHYITLEMQESSYNERQVVVESLNKEYQEYVDSLKVEREESIDYLAQIEVTDSIHIDSNELLCMQRNIYWEARNQKSREALAAVGYVVMNRKEDSRYPNSICGVVRSGKKDENGDYILNQCSFSWKCNGKTTVPNLADRGERAAWDRAGRIAERVILGEIDNPVGDALFYHATYVSPRWSRGFEKVAKIETHIFYRTNTI